MDKLKLDNKLLRLDINKQCEDRFGMSWQEVRETMDKNTNNGFELLPMVKFSPKSLLVKISGETSNWMLNRFVVVLYLKHAFFEPKNKDYMQGVIRLNQLIFEFLEDKEDPTNPGQKINKNLETILDIAPYVCPDKVKSILDGYGLLEK